MRAVEPEIRHRCVDVRAPDEPNEHIGRGVIAIGDHQPEQILDAARRADSGIGEVAPAVIFIVAFEVHARIEIERAGFHLLEDLDHDRNFDRRSCGKALRGVDARRHAGGEIFHCDADATGRVPRDVRELGLQICEWARARIERCRSRNERRGDDGKGQRCKKEPGDAQCHGDHNQSHRRRDLPTFGTSPIFLVPTHQRVCRPRPGREPRHRFLRAPRGRRDTGEQP